MPMQQGTLRWQHVGEIQYAVKCGNCGAHARWSPLKLPKNIAKTARCDDSSGHLRQILKGKPND
jgi:hypothetical protein